jgi:hypothetical protein
MPIETPPNMPVSPWHNSIKASNGSGVVVARLDADSSSRPRSLQATIHASIAWSGFQRSAERAHGPGQIDHEEQRVSPVEDWDFSEVWRSKNWRTADKILGMEMVGWPCRLRAPWRGRCD